METPPEGYRRNVGICLRSPSKRVFTAESINIPGTWQMPQGQAEGFVNRLVHNCFWAPHVGALEEALDDMLYPCDGKKGSLVIHSRASFLQGGANEGEDLRSAATRELREETGVTSTEFLAELENRFLFRSTGKEDEINLLGDQSEKPEFNNWSWMLPEQVVELALDFKKPLYKQVMQLFGPYLQAEVSEGNLSEENESNATVYVGSASA